MNESWKHIKGKFTKIQGSSQRCKDDSDEEEEEKESDDGYGFDDGDFGF